MDNYQLLKVISVFGHLKYRYLGSFPSDLVPERIPNGMFCIVNIDRSDQGGTHWILFANKDGRVFFGDSMGKALNDYPNIHFDSSTARSIIPLVSVGQQLQYGSYCGLYCIYFAHVLYSNSFSECFIDDNFLLRFFSTYT